MFPSTGISRVEYVGRPHGSTDGRQPLDGYPDLADDFGHFLAGFIEGEGSFVIARQSRNTNHRCSMQLTVRDDDAPLLLQIRECTNVGSITRRPGRGSARPQIAWKVASKADCSRLADLLVRYPLRGRKGADFALWLDGVRWWVGKDATRRHVNRDWAPLVYIRRRLIESRTYSPNSSPVRDSVKGMSGDWVSFLSGLFTADGCFGVHVNGSSLIPVAKIQLRADDAPLLRELWRRTEVGRLLIGAVAPRGKRSPEASWAVRGAGDAERLAQLLDRDPPRGQKGRQYALWRDAVTIYATAGGGRFGRPGWKQFGQP
jgi:hypothetical protein